MELRPLGIADLDVLVALFARVVSSMREEGIDQWDELYPDRDVLERDLRAGEGFALFPVIQGAGNPLRAAEEPAAYVALNGEESPEYSGVSWSLADESPLVIHRLCVDPRYRGRGAAKRLLSFAEDFAARGGRRSIRLDAFSLNPAALALYESLGYGRRGEVFFRKGRFVCFEKIL